MGRILPAGLAGLALTLAACGGGSEPASSDAGARRTNPDPTSASAPGGAPATPGTSTPTPAVPAALRFSAPALDGGKVEGADYATTGVALWFWAPW